MGTVLEKEQSQHHRRRLRWQMRTSQLELSQLRLSVLSSEGQRGGVLDVRDDESASHLCCLPASLPQWSLVKVLGRTHDENTEIVIAPSVSIGVQTCSLPERL